jgi:hypothetical protein
VFGGFSRIAPMKRTNGQRTLEIDGKMFFERQDNIRETFLKRCFVVFTKRIENGGKTDELFTEQLQIIGETIPSFAGEKGISPMPSE